MLALLPLLLSVAPYLARWVGAEGVMKQAGDIVEAVTGTRDPLGAAAALQDPAKAAELQLALAKLTAEAETERRRIELEELKASLADTQSARALSGASPLIARTQVSFGAVLILMMTGIIAFLAFRTLPLENRDLFNIVLGALIGEFRGALAFFFGGSTSGHSANNAMAAALGRMTSGAAAGQPIINQPSGTVVTGASAEELNADSLRRSRS